MGYILENDEAIVVKIDSGEALPFIDDLKNAKGIKHHPQTRDMVVGTNGTIMSFEELNKNDQKEFIMAVSDILMASDSQIKEIFKEFLHRDERFKKILASLLSRKADFLQAFTPEVRNKIGE